MEVVHFRFVRIELDPNLGALSGEVGEELFQLGVIFDNDGISSPYVWRDGICSLFLAPCFSQ